MGMKAKVRFYARANKFNAELFSIRELSSGDLHVRHKHSIFHEVSADELVPVIESYQSIHMSLEAETPAHTITGTVSMVGGRTFRQVAMVDCDGAPFLWPFITRRHNDMSHDQHAMKARDKDVRIRVATYDPRYFTLLSTALVAHAGTFEPGPMAIPWNWSKARFRRFDVFVGACVMPVPSMEKGDNSYPMTSPATLDGEPMQDFERRLGQTVPPDKIEQVIDSHARGLSFRYFERYGEAVVADRILQTRAQIESVSERMLTYLPIPK